jgi:hypothetical protein
MVSFDEASIDSDFNFCYSTECFKIAADEVSARIIVCYFHAEGTPLYFTDPASADQNSEEAK